MDDEEIDGNAVHIAPLLSPLDSNTQDNHDRHVVANSVSEACPYARYRLINRDSPPATLPRCVERTRISSEGWIKFWSQLQVHVLKMNEHERRGSYVSCGCGTVVWMCVAVQFMGIRSTYFDDVLDDPWGWLRFFILPGLLPPIFMLFARLVYSFVYLQKWHSLFSEIETFCQEADEVSMFHVNGFSLECELFPGDFYGSIPYVLLLPSDKPYTRFEVYNGLHGRSSTYVTSLVSGSIQPDCFETIPSDEWSEFWSAMRELYEPQSALLPTYLLVFAGLTVLWVFTTTERSAGITILGLLTLGCLSLAVCYNVNHSLTFLPTKLSLVHEWAFRFAQYHVFMEHRRLSSFHSRWRTHERHYIYMFPLTSDEADDDPVTFVETTWRRGASTRADWHTHVQQEPNLPTPPVFVS